MTQETTRKFVGRAILIDPATGQDSVYSVYVCVLLIGTAGVPSVTICEAPSADDLLTKLRTNDLNSHFSRAKVSFDPPAGDYPINQSSARQRYEALSFHEFNRVQTILSGR